MLLVVPQFSLGNRETLGVLCGILAALAFTLRNLIGRKMLVKVPTLSAVLWQFVLAAVLFLPWGIASAPSWTVRDWVLLVILGVFLTGVPHALFMSTLKTVTSRHASLMTSAQPVLSVIFAVAFLGEHPSLRTLAGGVLVLTSVFAVAFTKRA